MLAKQVLSLSSAAKSLLLIFIHNIWQQRLIIGMRRIGQGGAHWTSLKDHDAEAFYSEYKRSTSEKSAHKEEYRYDSCINF